MLASDMTNSEAETLHNITAVYQHELDEDPSVHDEEDDYLDDNFAPDGIDTPSDDIYNIHNTNFDRLHM